MTVRELKKKLAELPEGCDGMPVVSFQAVVKPVFNGSSDDFIFTGFEDIELKRVHADINKVRLN